MGCIYFETVSKEHIIISRVISNHMCLMYIETLNIPRSKNKPFFKINRSWVLIFDFNKIKWILTKFSSSFYYNLFE